jgi:hypothetical protein
MEFVPLLVMLATVTKLVDFIRYAKAGEHNGIVTQLVAWAGGFLLVALAANTAWAQGIVFGDVPLSTMGLASQALAGIALGSTASLAHDAVTRTPTAPALTSR